MIWLKMGRILFVLLLIDSTLAWSKRHPKPAATTTNLQKSPLKAEVASQEDANESKLSEQYAHQPKSRHYIIEEDDHYHPEDSSKGEEEYVDSEDRKSHHEKYESEGHHDLDSNKKDDAHKDYSEKGAYQEFEQGGASFDKHAKDHKVDNKEIENIKQHDVGSKFGGEAVKEHKLGKHRDKSKGHKTHGFKNVYHKEEYGDHKTFHDEFLDKDSLHDYDDHHEHKEVKGGKFSKGLKHEGKNKKYDKGDEKHQWGKSGYDGAQDGRFEKEKHTSKHHHGTKKRKGHHNSDAYHDKQSVHKIKKGNPPIHISHGGHHGPHQAQIQPYVPHHHHHTEHVPVSHHNPHHGHQDSGTDDYSHESYHNAEDDGYEPRSHHKGHHGQSSGHHQDKHDHHHRDHHASDHHHGHHGHKGNGHERQLDFPDKHKIDDEELVPEKHVKNDFIEQKEDRGSDQIHYKPEHLQPVAHKFHQPYYSQPISHKGHYRQPLFESRDGKRFHDDEYQKRYHRIRFGAEQPRNHHHSFNSHHNSQSFRPMNGHQVHDALRKHQDYPRNYDQHADNQNARVRGHEHLTPQVERDEKFSTRHH